MTTAAWLFVQCVLISIVAIADQHRSEESPQIMWRFCYFCLLHCLCRLLWRTLLQRLEDPAHAKLAREELTWSSRLDTTPASCLHAGRQPHHRRHHPQEDKTSSIRELKVNPEERPHIATRYNQLLSFQRPAWQLCSVLQVCTTL